MNPLGKKCIAEFIATFTLTFIGAGAIITIGGSAGIVGSTAGVVAVALAHGLALSMAVFATGHISGGHVNPAVTLAMFSRKKISGGDAAAYIGAQLAGAIVACLILKGVFPGADGDAKLGATLGSLSNDENALKVLLLESIVTFLLVTTIFGVAVDKRGPKNVYGFAIGLTVAFDILCVGTLTGASMNPARSFGPALVGGHWDIHWVYWAGPILGACVAAFVYDALLIGKDGDSEES